MIRASLLTLLCIAAFAMPDTGVSLAAQSAEPIRYTLRFPAPHTHYVEVEAVYPTAGRPQVELFMAVWTPGSYLVREYERHVENVTAKSADGRSQSVEKTRKNRWRVESGGANEVTVSYRVYGREMTVRNNWIESGFAMINGAPTFLTLVGGGARAHEVRIELASGWKTSATALTPVAGAANSYRAEDFDTLVDSPIIVGNPVIETFTVDAKPHHLVFEGDPSVVDAERAATDTQKIVQAAREVWGQLPYPHYFFLDLVTDSGGGLEHKNSTMLMSGRFMTRTRRAYLGWLGLVSHEYFHNWNVKRLRPIELGPFDYETEVYTKGLWIAEGFTDYYGGLIVARAGLSSRDEFLDDVSGHIEAVQNVPGRLTQPVGMASYDTWIKQYRPDENSVNTSINYYPKGAVIAFLLDAKIRRATSGAKTLDDAMRLAYQRYSGAKGYTLDQFYQTMGEVAGTDLKPWFASVVDTTGELDYTAALDWFGLRFKPVDSKDAKAWLGFVSRNDAGRLLVTQVRRGTPAHEAGINVDDEILAIDDVRVRGDGLAVRLDQFKAGDQVTVLVARRDRLTRLPVTLSAEPGRTWRLELVPTASEEQLAHFAAWTKLK